MDANFFRWGLTNMQGQFYYHNMILMQDGALYVCTVWYGTDGMMVRTGTSGMVP